MGSYRPRAVTAAIVILVASILFVSTMPDAKADNVVGSPSNLALDAGTSNTQLKVKIVSNTAQSQSGDPVSGCNVGVKDDGKVVSVTLLISPSAGLLASPNPIVFDECNKVKTVTLTGVIGGTYGITATAEDNAPGDGVYHLNPFGTVTVVVVDTIPPETTITSGPANPTAIQSAEFEFTSNEASTFECSLNNAAFAGCTSPASYSGLLVGDHTFQVRATDLSGKADPTPASYSWTINALSIAITTVSPSTALWGTPVLVEGTADVVDVSGLSVTVDWGDGNTDSGLEITGGAWGAVSHPYFDTGDFTITANLTDGVSIKASATFVVSMNKHVTKLTLSLPEHVTGSTKFLASGNLTDESLGGIGVSGRTIDFAGDANPASLETQGVTFEGIMSFVSCDISPGECSPDPDPVSETPASSDNIVLHLDVGGKITFPHSTGQAIVYLQDMGTTPFKYKVIEYPDIPQDCDLLADGLQDECSSAGEVQFIAKIDAVSGYETVGGIKAYNGIKEIIITEVDGSSSSGSIGISAIITRSIDTDPTDQHLINFESMPAPSTPASPLIINSGSYHATGVAQSDPAPGLSLEAEFDGDDLYEESASDPVFYTVIANLNGFGATFIAAGSGTSVTEYACTGLSDFDNDGICDEFEDASPPAIFVESLSPTISWRFPTGELPGSDMPDIYYEIDCMTGFCPAQAELNYIEGRFLKEGIRLHLMVDQTNLTVCNPLKVWSDADANFCNDFRSIKERNYGTDAERTAAGGNLAQGKTLFTLKSQAVRYLLFAKNIEIAGGGPTGIAEFKGNDAIVAIDSIPAAAADKDETRIGTIMHEIGHNLGLLHGGTDDVNCKPNYVSIMNYNRQVPHSKMPVPAANAATSVGWYGDYSHGDILLRNSANAPIGDGKSISEGDLDDGNKLTRSGTWLAFDGVTTITSFKLMWGTPTLNTAVQTANTATLMDWDKDVETANDSNQAFDINFLSVTIGGSQLPACTEAPLISTIKAGGDDYATIRSNIAKFNGASSAFLGLTPAAEGDPNSIPEENVDVHNALNGLDYEFLGVENPLNNVAFGEQGIATSKKGNTIHVRFNFNDGLSTLITGDNIQSYPIDKIILQVARVTSGEPPSDEEYFPPATSTQGDNSDFFTWDGSKWSFQWGTKPLSLGTYAARIYVVQSSGEGVVLDHNGDGISFLVQLVKS